MSMAQKKCGKCEKTVYPTEEVKCLDKSWHKGCLKCTACGTTLNIKNVKGYEKMPYCNVHYPQPKPTVVTDNPEMQRIRMLTDLQSNAKYHEDFNKNKGKFTAVADDPATTRAKEQQRNVSQAEYTGKRKDSTSQVLASDNNQASNGDNTTTTTNTNTNSTRSSSTSEPTVGRVADYDPINDDRGSLARGYEPTSKAMHATKFETAQKSVSEAIFKSNPLATNNDNNNNNNDDENGTANKRSSTQYEEEVKVQSNDIHHDDQPAQDSHGDTRPNQKKVRALYAYVAAEADEISFNEGDTLVECEQIDDGWMLGKNPKTGQQGLLPSNYVEVLD